MPAPADGAGDTENEGNVSPVGLDDSEATLDIVNVAWQAVLRSPLP
jgi:hypothetical protein